jgi:hypothetical protein
VVGRVPVGRRESGAADVDHRVGRALDADLFDHAVRDEDRSGVRQRLPEIAADERADVAERAEPGIPYTVPSDA